LIFAYQVSDPSHYGVVEFDDDGKVISIEEKPLKPRARMPSRDLFLRCQGSGTRT